MTTQTKATSAPPAKQAGRTSSGSADTRRTPWGFILPALVPLILITIGPLIFLYYISLTDFELGTSLSEARWVGLDNYIRLFSGQDPQFWVAISNTVKIAVVATAIELILGFGIALLIDGFNDRMKGILIAILMLPMVVTPVIVGLVWKLMMNSEQGVINWALGYIGLQPAWLGPELSLTSVMIVEIWQWTPFVALILLAGLASLPTEPHEAAAIDGATGWQSLIYITLPLLMPVVVLAVLLRLIDVLKIFDIIFIMTGGGPGSSTETLAIHSFRQGFYFTGWIGRASATAVVLAVLTTAVSAIMIVRLQRISRSADMIHQYRKRWFIVLRWVLLAAIIFLAIFPIYFMVTTSFKYPIQTYDPTIWLFYPTLANYQSLFQNYAVASRLFNSLIVTGGSVLLALVLGALAAYGFAKYEFRGKENIAGWMLSMRFLPAISVVIPLFLIANSLHVLDTQGLLIVVYLTFNVPFAAWMLRGFFDEIPVELEDAAMVDGASRWQTLVRIVLPLSTPGIFATAALLVIGTWNEFALALFLATYQARTMPTMTSQFQSVRGILWGELTALGVLTTLPVLIFAILARKYLVRGLTFGALK